MTYNKKMKLHFYKFDGAGNDFVMLDAREGMAELSPQAIAHICHRRKGVGADGLILLTMRREDGGVAMRYYNADGYPADMCGNGGRCLAMFAHLLGLSHRVGKEATLRFWADDGEHQATILHWDADRGQGVVRLSMRDVPKATLCDVLQGKLLNTGVPHYVQQVKDLAHYDVVGEGRRLRHHPDLGPEGANVNFVEPAPDGSLCVRTYERGVEDETWACGTGVTACALVTDIRHLSTRGGEFEMGFDTTEDCYRNVQLTGPVSYNFTGTISVEG